MIKDPLTIWDGPFPYDELAPAGVTPDSAHAQLVDDAPFTLMSMGMMTPGTQQALDELGDLRRRLVADFLLYDVDLAEEIARVRGRLGDVPEPPEVTDALAISAQALAELVGDLAGAIPAPGPEVPERPDFGAFPAQSLIDGLIQFDR